MFRFSWPCDSLLCNLASHSMWFSDECSTTERKKLVKIHGFKVIYIYIYLYIWNNKSPLCFIWIYIYVCVYFPYRLQNTSYVTYYTRYHDVEVQWIVARTTGHFLFCYLPMFHLVFLTSSFVLFFKCVLSNVG